MKPISLVPTVRFNELTTPAVKLFTYPDDPNQWKVSPNGPSDPDTGSVWCDTKDEVETELNRIMEEMGEALTAAADAHAHQLQDVGRTLEGMAADDPARFSEMLKRAGFEDEANEVYQLVYLKTDWDLAGDKFGNMMCGREERS